MGGKQQNIPKEQKEEELARKFTAPDSPGGEEITFREAAEGAIETQPGFEWERKIKEKLADDE